MGPPPPPGRRGFAREREEPIAERPFPSAGMPFSAGTATQRTTRVVLAIGPASPHQIPDNPGRSFTPRAPAPLAAWTRASPGRAFSPQIESGWLCGSSSEPDVLAGALSLLLRKVDRQPKLRISFCRSFPCLGAVAPARMRFRGFSFPPAPPALRAPGPGLLARAEKKNRLPDSLRPAAGGRQAWPGGYDER